MALLSVVLAAAAAFILLYGQSLPPVVASHFGAGGNADSLMPRDAYILMMVFVTVGIPLLLALCNSLLRLFPVTMINLPNRGYWLAPERREETFQFLRDHGAIFSAVIAVFLCFIHWLVVQANATHPPHLSMSWLIAALGLFLAALIFWTGVLIVHFRRSQ